MTKATKQKEVQTIDVSKYESKSAAIRDLNAKGYTRSQIAKMLNIRYQHVRNVLITPLMRDIKEKK